MKEIETYRDLLNVLQEMPGEQLDQPIQCVKPHPDESKVNEMQPALAIGTVAEFEFFHCRSTHNNRYCPDDVVLLMDGNHFGEDGVVAWTQNPDNPKFSMDGMVPEYGRHGKTSLADQTAPDTDKLREKWQESIVNHVLATVSRRAKRVHERIGGVDSDTQARLGE